MKTKRILTAVTFLAVITLSLRSCMDSLKISMGYDFTLNTLPYRTSVEKGECRRIECEIVPKGEYSKTVYTIRYFLESGEGSLSLEDGRLLQESRDYILPERRFSLLYTSSSSETDHSIIVHISDNFSHTRKLQITLSQQQ